MRIRRTMLHWAGIVFVALLGCKHQPELKPPEQPEVLATPGDNDKRYEQPCCYPPEVLASDPTKKGDGITPPGSKRGAPMGMSGSSLGGMAPPGNGS